MPIVFWLPFGLTVFVASMIPGPSTLLAFTHGATCGWRRALATAAGNALASTLQAIAASAGLGAVLYYLVNGYLFGREYFELVSHRRIAPPVAKNLRRSKRGTVMLLGCAAAFGMTIPFLNLVTPIIAAAAMVHVFMKIAQNTPMEGDSRAMEKTETTFP